jgi:hypothetical protein
MRQRLISVSGSIVNVWSTDVWPSADDRDEVVYERTGTATVMGKYE